MLCRLYAEADKATGDASDMCSAGETCSVQGPYIQ
jgi:hypothetical protein